MRVATWNLLHGIALVDPQEAPNLAQVASSISADLIGLQEVDRQQIRSNFEHQTKTVADAMGLPYWVYAPAITGTPGESWEGATDSHVHSHQHPDPDPELPHYGVGLASRYPMTSIEVMRFKAAPISLPLLVPSNPRPRMIKVADEPRVAIIADVETPLGTVTVATTHLSFVPGFNVSQLRKLTKHLSNRTNPVIIFGDFNLPGKTAKLVSRWDSLAELPTYPTFKPRIQFDHVISRGLDDASIQRARDSALAMQLAISDHCALVVEIT
jgi:endonuclease/exonuclease/phosphatase family metal-dependent hydrolase